ncbi:Smg protein [Sulfuritortus calidifontis]|uniref:Protein Smg homolog n=1 Tax=Sulfuritortus calidifontis TaxID=1914471 RepID=A0A4R3JTM3_9PROT|nr:DUF494 domain-containing protein [Sulfuritortus calidifontis]TCS69712.1 Smg protein [Sulfuritortus calidifontis]
MFEILQYLYENYLADDYYPDVESLARKLLAAGFEQAEIDRALDWLSGLESLTPQDENGQLAHAGLRHYTDLEISRLDAAGRGFITYLESAGLLSPYGREWVIERALALDDREVPADKIKWIALIALWRLGGPLEAFWLEDLVQDLDDEPPTLH